ncbi:MAG: biotin/lipoyl-containing protein [Syntrophobacteraceae bacterium]
MKYQISVGDDKYEVEVESVIGGRATVTVNRVSYEVTIDNYEELRTARADVTAGPVSPAAVSAARPAEAPYLPPQKTVQTLRPSEGLGNIMAPLPGRIVEVMVSIGDQVTVGQPLIKIEAMKMINNITAMLSGTVKEVLTREGAEVSTGDVLLIIG